MAAVERRKRSGTKLTAKRPPPPKASVRDPEIANGAKRNLPDAIGRPSSKSISSRFSVISPRPKTVQPACLTDASATYGVVPVTLPVACGPGERARELPARRYFVARKAALADQRV